LPRFKFPRAALAAALLAASLALPARAADPIRIGFSDNLTGGSAPNGKQLLLSFQIWRDDVNAKGGIMGRPVELVFYDDQTNPSNVPGIYTKLIDIDKVDLVVGPYGTNFVAPAIPVVMQHNKLTLGLFAVDVNRHFHYNRYFSMISTGSNAGPRFSEGFFGLAAAQTPKPKTVAIIGADAEFGRTLTDGAVENAKAAGFEIVYRQNYPPPTQDFAPIIRALQATHPDLVFVASYPPDSVGIVRAISEVGLDAKMVGGLLTGLLATPFKLQLGPLLNGIVNNQIFTPGPAFDFPGTKEFLAKYQAQAPGQGLDPLGFAFAPFAYATGQVVAQAVEGAQSLDQDKPAQYMHSHGFHTIVGDIAFNEDGEWVKPRQVFTQFQNIKANDIDQFRDGSHEPILWPPEMKSGAIIYPFTAARK
jgi:branched-chain amino acid transport system substrate-binding protein